MELSQLDLFGFKSFADKTTLKFKTGITAIVGPNGCGKSNISDAFRWVLGEQSAKSLRGTKMLDVIFAGTEKRKPLNFAEVTLTFTGMDQVTPYSEVAVTRRLHRNGDSEYFINKKSVRLKDIWDLFLDSGVGKDAFAIFEQGKIDQVINHSPFERRYIFEDAAGILRFLQRKKEALGKLEQVDLNLSRVKDIHSEVEKQIAQLEEQVVKAKEYKEKKAQFEQLEKGILFTKWQNFSRQLLNLQAAKQALMNQTLGEELEKEIGALKESKEALEGVRRLLNDKVQAVHKLEREIALSKQQLQSRQTALKELEQNEKKWRQNGVENSALRQERGKEKARLLQEESDAKNKLKEFDEKLISQREHLKTVDREMGETRQQQLAVEKERYQLVGIEKALDSEMKQTLVRLEHALEKRNTLASTKAELTEAIDELLVKILAQEGLKANLEKELAEEKAVFSEAEKSGHTLTQELLEVEKQLTLKHKRMAECQARKNVLQKLREEKPGFSQGSKQLLKEAGTKGSPLFQKLKPLYECVRNDNGQMMAAVMRPYAQTLAVQSKEDLKAVLDFAKQQNLKDFSLICEESLSFREEYLSDQKGVIPLFKPEDDRISRHFLNGVFSAESLDVQVSYRALWVEEGIYVDPNGVLFYQIQGENHPFLREAELKKIEKELKIEEAESLEFEKGLSLFKERQQILMAEKKRLDEGIRKKELLIVESNYVLKRLQGEREGKQAQLAKVDTEGKGLESVFLDFELKKKELENKLIIAEERVQAIQAQHVRAEELYREKHALYQEQQKRLQECDFKQREGLDKWKKMVHALQVVELKEQESEREEKRLQEELKNCAQKQKEMEEEAHVILQDVEKSTLLWQSSEGELKEIKERVLLQEKQIGSKEQVIENKRHELKAYEEKGYQLGIQIAQTESMLLTFANELQGRYHKSPEEGGEPLEIPLEKAERKLKQLRLEVENGDQINLASIEECEKHKVRYAFLQQQLTDLEVAKQELVHIITDLDGSSRKIFKETFEAIRENFRKNFAILFQGGAADLQFTETSDVLEAGIEIVSQPPGKKNAIDPAIVRWGEVFDGYGSLVRPL